METKIILGGAGTGKTTRLMKVLDQEMSAGIKPHRIAFMSFTKKAAEEAMTRACEKFNCTPRQFPYFKTVHSLAYGEAGVSRNMVMQPRDHRQIATQLGLTYTGYSTASDGAFSGDGKADTFLSVIQYAKATKQSLRDAWHTTGGGVEWFRLKQYSDTLDQFKQSTGKLDFDDMLQRYIEVGFPLNIDVAIIDEAQDLSAMQWDVARKLCGKASRIYVAGDDDQAIFSWSGADIDQFVGMDGDVEVLPVSYRLPKVVYDEAVKISSKIGKRREKTYTPTDKDGSVNWWTQLDKDKINNGETWYLLARNSFMLKDFKEDLHENGIPYTTVRGSSIKKDHVMAIIMWERLRKGKSLTKDDVNKALNYLGSNSVEPFKIDKEYSMQDVISKGVPKSVTERRWDDALTGIDQDDIYYYLNVMRNGYKLQDIPKTYMGTIHSVKGGEADNVVICTDITHRSFQSMQKFPDDEHRIFYVGVTRTKKDLFYIQPKTNMFYPI